MEAAPASRKRSATLWLLPILVALLVAVGYFLQHRQSSQDLFASTPATDTSSASAESKAAAPAPPSPSPSTTPAQTVPAAMPKDIKAWVQAWADAINTRDVPYQLSFYATPVDRYFLTPNVSREHLLKDKQAEIDDRKGTWTLKAEDVDVQKETATNAVVVLIKHITVELPASPVRQERLKAQLKLKLVDGSWKITSERTIA
jgi:ketosteroid isomerase-like protein